ncbi:MAG: glycine cleavage system aminomethyltransferase GcvT [Thermomicrobiales bacterium]
MKRTPIYDRHVAAGARIIPFAGWEMPVQYEGILAEHRRVRTQAGLFDLGHMGQVDVTGPDALAFLQYATTNDVSKLAPGEAAYGLLPNDTGGVVDDIFVYRMPEGREGYFVVINAANIERDLARFAELRARRSDLDVTITHLSDVLGMIAIQGPKSEAIIQKLTDIDLAALPHFTLRECKVAGIPVRLGRTGYTGEDGFELFPAIEQTGALWDAIMDAGKDEGLAPIGLGARDTLRLEARMPLYGQELGDDISPYEAGVGWAVKLDKGNFVSRDAMAAVKAEGPKRKTVGFKTIGKAPAPRTHYDVQVDGRKVGEVTSGAFSPTLEENIGLALIEAGFAGVGKPLQVIVRGKPVDAIQVKVPFYKRASN